MKKISVLCLTLVMVLVLSVGVLALDSEEVDVNITVEEYAEVDFGDIENTVDVVLDDPDVEEPETLLEEGTWTLNSNTGIQTTVDFSYFNDDEELAINDYISVELLANDWEDEAVPGDPAAYDSDPGSLEGEMQLLLDNDYYEEVGWTDVEADTYNSQVTITVAAN
ncbi:MAG: hypothetical protein ACOC4G_06640 [Bacillota bacterium]